MNLNTTDISRPAARIVLPGSGTGPADVEVVYQPRATRYTRAILALVVSWLAIPVVFFIPPHIPWALAAFGLGVFLFWRTTQGEYFVASFEGACPRCAEPLALKSGARIRGRHTLECYGCHRQPELVLDEPGD